MYPQLLQFTCKEIEFELLINHYSLQNVIHYAMILPENLSEAGAVSWKWKFVKLSSETSFTKFFMYLSVEVFKNVNQVPNVPINFKTFTNVSHFTNISTPSVRCRNG